MSNCIVFKYYNLFGTVGSVLNLGYSNVEKITKLSRKWIFWCNFEFSNWPVMLSFQYKKTLTVYPTGNIENQAVYVIRRRCHNLRYTRVSYSNLKIHCCCCYIEGLNWAFTIIFHQAY